MRRDGSGSALRGVGSCARRSQSRSRRGISGDKRKDGQRSKTRDCRGWASPFRTDGRRKAGGPRGGSGGRVGPRSTCETDGTKKFQRAKEPSVGKQRWRRDPARRSSHELVGKKCFCHCSLDEVCHVDEILKVMDDEQRARTRDDRPPVLGGMSLAEVGLALKSHLLAPRSEPAASVVNFVLRHSGLERGGISKGILAFPLSFCPTAAEISLSLEAGRAQLGEAEGAEASLDEYIQEAGLEAWTFLVTLDLNFVYSGRLGERVERPETSWNS